MSDKDAKKEADFKAWLATRGGFRVTEVKGDHAWNDAVEGGALKRVTRKDSK